MTFENAYFGSRPSGPEVVSRLIAELHSSIDSYTRGKFCELLGEMGDASVLPVLERELGNEDENIRIWAAQAIAEIQSPQNRAAKQQHLANFKVGDAEGTNWRN